MNAFRNQNAEKVGLVCIFHQVGELNKIIHGQLETCTKLEEQWFKSRPDSCFFITKDIPINFLKMMERFLKKNV